jgi:hypothetical protein
MGSSRVQFAAMGSGASYFRWETRKTNFALAVFLIWTIFNLLSVERVRAQSPNYQGKTMTIIVGTVAGDL